MIRIVKNIFTWYKNSRIERRNRKLVRDLEKVFEGSGISKKVDGNRRETDEKVYEVSFHNKRDSTDN